MQEMKLFDIETGKYLELGTDWLYGGNGILLIDIMQKELNESLEIAITNAIQGNERALYQYSYGKMKTEPQGTLKTLCDLTGAVVYGNRYVLIENKECGNIYCKKNKWGTVYYLNEDIYSFIPCPEFNPENDKKATVQMFFSLDKCEDNLINNIFEEYSKSLRNQENKLGEILNLIK